MSDNTRVINLTERLRNVILVGMETALEAIVPDFAFDESKGIEENLDAFFSHLKGYDDTFAAHLRAQLPAVVGDRFDRAEFNKGIVEMLDNETDPQPNES